MRNFYAFAGVFLCTRRHIKAGDDMIEELKDGEFLIKSSESAKVWRSELNGNPIIEFEAWVSTEAIDRDGEIIRADGWRKKSLQKPKLLLFHKQYDTPIGMPYWTRVKEQEDTKGLYTRGRMGPQLQGLAVGELYLNGDMDSFSVGFRWYKRVFDEEADGIKKPFYEYRDQDLWEYSAVNVPANPEATIAAINDTGDVKDMMAIIKALTKQSFQGHAFDRDSYSIKSDTIKAITDRLAKIEKKQNETDYDASEYEGDDVDIEDDLDDEVEVDVSGDEGDTSDDLVEVLVETGDDADIDIEI